MSVWVVYVRQGCHLCETFLLELSLELGAEEFERVLLVDVDQDAEVAVEYGLRVPVLALDGAVICEAQVDSARIQALTRL